MSERSHRSRVGSCRTVLLSGLVALTALAACGRFSAGAAEKRPPAPTDSWTGGLSFQNRVWVVERSNAVAKGSARIFLWDGTLVMTGPGSDPAFGRWLFERGRLRIVEEGIAYETEILESAGDRLRLRMLSAGEPVLLEMRDARPPWVDAVPR